MPKHALALQEKRMTDHAHLTPAAAPTRPGASGQPGTSALNGRLWSARAQDWADIQEGQFRTAYGAVFDGCGLGRDTRYCDVGCGAGMAAMLASGRGAQVSGLDAAEGLLAIARGRTPAGDFRTGDLEELPFDDAQFDLVTGFNAFQFAANPTRALAEARRVTKPDGRVVVMTWGTPEGMQAAALVAALKPLLPPPPPGAPGPFALSQPSALRALAESAGLRPLEVFDVACHWAYPDLATALRGLGSSGVAVRAAELSGAQAVDDAHAAALGPLRQADGSYRIGAAFRWLMAAP
jgi:SAM-dependent methyltransferase